MANSWIPYAIEPALNIFQKLQEQKALRDIINEIYSPKKLSVQTGIEPQSLTPEQLLNKLMVENEIKQTNAQNIVNKILTNAWISPENKKALLTMIQSQFADNNTPQLYSEMVKARQPLIINEGQVAIDPITGQPIAKNIQYKSAPAGHGIYNPETGKIENMIPDHDFKYDQQSGRYFIVNKTNGNVVKQGIGTPNSILLLENLAEKMGKTVADLTPEEAKNIIELGKREGIIPNTHKAIETQSGIIVIDEITGDIIGTFIDPMTAIKREQITAETQKTLFETKKEQELLPLEKRKTEAYIKYLQDMGVSMKNKNTKQEVIKLPSITGKSDTFNKNFMVWENNLKRRLERGMPLTKSQAINHINNLFHFENYKEGQDVLNKYTIPDTATTPQSQSLGIFDIGGTKVRVTKIIK